MRARTTTTAYHHHSAGRVLRLAAEGDAEAVARLARDAERRGDRERLALAVTLLAEHDAPTARRIARSLVGAEVGRARVWCDGERSALRVAEGRDALRAGCGRPRWLVEPVCVPLVWDEARARLFAVACAAQALPAHAARYPEDDSLGRALTVAAAHVRGQADDEALAAAHAVASRALQVAEITQQVAESAVGLPTRTLLAMAGAMGAAAAACAATCAAPDVCFLAASQAIQVRGAVLDEATWERVAALEAGPDPERAWREVIAPAIVDAREEALGWQRERLLVCLFSEHLPLELLDDLDGL